MNRILIIDDDRELCALIKRSVQTENIVADFCNTGKEGLQKLKEQEYQLVILDVMMPGMDGFETLEEIRKEHSLPILMFTSKNDSISKVRGLRAGADDYLTKPFDMDELDARLRALLRRAAGRASPTIRLGDIELDPATRTVRQQGKPVEMSPREFSVLLVLLEARGRVLSRQQIEERLYSWDAAVESNAVEVHIHHLRRKLGSAAIQTMRGVGYFMPQDKPA